MYDVIVIGSGFAGAVVADKMAKAGKKVLVLEKRNHIGGNCYDEYDEHGILIHKYGPHIFHTNSKEVYDYLSQYTEWYNYRHEVVAKVNDMHIPVPFNLNTLKMVYGEKAEILEKKLVDEYGYGTKVPILKLRENPDEDIQAIAEYVYQNECCSAVGACLTWESPYIAKTYSTAGCSENGSQTGGKISTFIHFLLLCCDGYYSSISGRLHNDV